MISPDRNDLIETMRSHRICVLVPTYNNAGTLRDVLSRILRYSSDVIVVNDGSTDDSANIIESLGNSIHIVSYPENAGKGHALKTGFHKALELGYDYAITIDSDGQHYPEDIPAFVKAIVEHPGSLIVGERNLSDVDINGKSSFANRFSNFWFCVQTGHYLKDTQTGYRAYPLKKLHGLSMLTSRYEAELELLVFASWNGVKIISIPIQVYYPPQSERVSHFKPALDFTRISILNTILCLAAVIYGIPARTWNALSQRRLFNHELTAFTRRKGEKLDAALTFGRLFRSIYGFSFFAFWATCVFTPFASIYFSIGRSTDKKKLRFHKMLRWACALITRNYPGAVTTYENPGDEDFETPALIICNHQSHLDLPVLMSIYPKMIFLTNDWVWNNVFYGKIIHKAEFIPVSAGIEVIIPQLKDLTERGYSVVVFPEGTRSADCSILRFHQGAFYLAKELELDIVPMVLHGAGHYLPKKDFMFRKGKITLRIAKRQKYNRDGFEVLRTMASKYRRFIKDEYDDIVRTTEKSAYFKDLVLYKYAYRGWRIVSYCKKVLKQLPSLSPYIDNESGNVRNVRIINSGIGVFALLYALVNKNVEVYSFEENLKKHAVAHETAGIPKNLHIIHPVWASDYEIPDVVFDKTIILESEEYVPNYSSDKFNHSITIKRRTLR